MKTTSPNIADLFAEAVALPPNERDAYLDAACGDDTALRAELEALLAADQTDDDFLATPLASFSAESSYEGQQLGVYQVEALLGQGGMGQVYRATRADLGIAVAIKVIRTERATAGRMERFMRERRILGRLTHPNIARFLDAGTTPSGTPFVVMEYVEGVSLQTYVQEHNLNLRDRLTLFLQVCEAVSYAHQNLVIHRDLKPSNIWVSADGTVKLLDFGIAKLLDDTEATDWHTLTAEALLTPAYASPEQVERRPVTTATDVYALGIVLYEMLTGMHPHRTHTTSSPKDLYDAVLSIQPERPSAVWARTAHRPNEVSRTEQSELDTMALKALRKEPARRYTSVDAFAEDVRRFLAGQPIAARPESWWYVTEKFIARNRMAVLTSLAGTIALIVGLSLALWQGAVAATERDRAQEAAAKSDMAATFMVELFQVADPSRPNTIRADTLRLPMLLAYGVDAAHVRFAEHPDVRARVFDSIGEMYRLAGDYRAAAKSFHEAARAWEEDTPGETLAFARSLKYEAFMLMMMGHLDEAEPMQREVLAMRRRLLGDASSPVGSILKNLGTTMLLRGEFAVAETYYDEALENRKHYGHHTSGGVFLMEAFMGRLYFMQSRYTKADSILQISLARAGDSQEALLGKPVAYHWLGWVRRAQGRYDEAEQLHQQGLALRREMFGARHLRSAESLTAYADLLVHQLRLDEAEVVLQEAISIYTELGLDILDESHPLTELTRVFLLQGRLDEATNTLEQARAIRTRYLSDGHWQRAELEGLAGWLKVQQGDTESGRAHLAQSHATLSAIRGASHPKTLEVERWLATVARQTPQRNASLAER